MGDLVQKYITGTTAVKIASDIEQAVRGGHLAAGHQLPPVRQLAGELGVSPGTVASAYQVLQARAVLVANKRRGTRVSHRPLSGQGTGATRPRQVIPRGVIDLSDGNPDPALLPSFDRILRELKYKPRLYGEEPMHRGLIDLMRKEMKADGVHVGQCAAINGAMDGIDRLLAEHLRPGDRVAVEDPGFTGHHDLIASRGLSLLPVRIDAEGMLPRALERALAEGARAVVITLRAQSPTGAAMSIERAGELRRVLQRRPETLVIEDDHASFLCASVPCACVHSAGIKASRHRGIKVSTAGSLDALMPRCLDASSLPRWAHLRSFSKSFNPDLRLAVMTGDDQTMTMQLDRMVVIERWVSQLLQSTAHALLADKTIRAQVERAGRTYDKRREALIALLEDAGLEPMGRSGYNVWLPVQEETPTVQVLATTAGRASNAKGQKSATAGWAVAAGERFRLSSPPGIRITASRLAPGDAHIFASTLVSILSPSSRQTSM